MISKDDPRLATEDDLKNFIKEFKVQSITLFRNILNIGNFKSFSLLNSLRR
jgi:hypothetical protein